MMQARENRKASKARLLMDQKQTAWEEEMGGKRGLKNKKGLFYFFQVIENKESKPERTGTNRTLMIVKSLQSTEYEGDSRIDPV
ncbi:MAG: hypothetical protein ACRD2P_16380, partial [Terriglobia bacterium]